MNKLLEQMSAYCKRENEESKRIHDVLVEFINKAGGEIDTSTEENYNDTIYAYVWNEFAESCTEFVVDKVRVWKNNDVQVHIPDYYTEDDNDQWFSVMGGMVLVNATLYNLCECLHKYV